MVAEAKGAEDIRAVLFDFGGVIAEEGFREGLKAIAREEGLDPDEFFHLGREAVYESGYVVGRASEEDFWNLLCRRSGLSGYDPRYTEEILSRFTLRPSMLELVDQLRRRGYTTAILSDQTDWLDRLEKRLNFSTHFARVCNSYHWGKSKRDPRLFLEFTAALELRPGQTLFFDDDMGNVQRARSCGLKASLFTDVEGCREELANFPVRQPSQP